MFEFNATFIIAMLSFVVFILIMNAIFYRPILNIIRKRDDYINSNYENSKEFEKSALEYRQIYKDKIEQTQNKCRQEFKTSVEKFQNHANMVINTAKDASKLEIQKKKDELALRKQDLQLEIKNSLGISLAESVLTKIIGEN